MKKDLSSLDIHYLLKELTVLIDQKIDKIYHPEKKELLLQFHIIGQGKRILRIIAGKFMFLTDLKEEHSEPSGFCMFLRKHLDNARLRSLKQLESERIVEFVFEKKEGKEILIIELFGNGNIICTDDKYQILSAVEYHKWKDREINPKLKYEYPKKPANIFDLKLKDLKDAINCSDKESIVKTLAANLGFGGVYSEEICLLANIDKNTPPGKLTDKDINKLADTASSLLNNNISAKIIFENNEPIDTVPFDLKLYAQYNQKEFKTFSEALDVYVGSKKEIKKTAKQNQIEKLQRIIDTQKEQIRELEIGETKEREKAELIYNNYKLIDEILKEIQKASEKYSWQEIKEKLKGHKIIKEINLKDKKITIEI